MRPKGSRLFSCALDLFINITNAAPSFIPEAFPAVTVPSGSNAGLNLVNDSMLQLCFGYSSELKVNSSFLFLLLERV